MKKPVVVVTEPEYQKAQAVFAGVADLEVVAASLVEAELAGAAREKKAFAAIVGVEKYTGPLYEALPSGGVLARFGVGYDGIDFRKADSRGILVTNTPGVLEEAVAEQAVFLAGALLRKITVLNEEVRQGQWNVRLGNELKDKTWLVVGLGVIGKRVSQIVSFGFKARVFACETRDCDYREMKEKFGVERVSRAYQEVAPEADIISLHLPANDQTRRFLDYQKLDVLKPSAILVNNARGSLVDESVLYDALAGGKLAGAALDVFQNEPYRPAHPDKDLRRLPNLIFAPHNASSTEEACRRMAERSLQNIRYALKQEVNKMDLISGGKKR